MYDHDEWALIGMILPHIYINNNLDLFPIQMGHLFPVLIQACAVMALERIPADIRKDGGVARMTDPKVFDCFSVSGFKQWPFTVDIFKFRYCI